MSNEKRKNYIWIGLLILFMILPAFLNMVMPKTDTVSSTEKRNLAEKPAWTAESFQEYPQRYTEYFNDHLLLRSSLIEAESFLQYKLFHTSMSANVIPGKEDWLFYDTHQPGNPVDNYKGLLRYSEEEIDVLCSSVESARARLAEDGILFTLMLVPNKEEVYPEYMPDSIVRISETGRETTLKDGLREKTGVLCIDPTEVLLLHKDMQELYYKQDTHWNVLGADLAMTQFMETVLDTRENPEEWVIEQAECSHKDLADLMHMGFYFHSIEHGRKEAFALENWYDGAHHNEQAERNERVMLIGDSFRESLNPCLQLRFKDVYIVHRDDFQPEMLTEFAPDIVIWQCVDRNSGGLVDMTRILGIE